MHAADVWGGPPARRRAGGSPARTLWREQTFYAVMALLFAVSAAWTIAWSASMSGSMPAMQMPGGWTMSMAWMRMPGQTWPGAAASFVGMWIVMMVPMMLPALVPMLARTPFGPLTALVALGYFFVWTLVGTLVFPLGALLGALEMQQPAVARAVPIAIGVVVLIAGCLQLTAWKARQLACCRQTRPRAVTPLPDARFAWRHGLRLGIDCGRCCANLMAILLAAGVMDLRVMGFVTAAITAERLAPAGERVARGIGVVLVGAGLCLMARANRP